MAPALNYPLSAIRCPLSAIRFFPRLSASCLVLPSLAFNSTTSLQLPSMEVSTIRRSVEDLTERSLALRGFL